MRPILRPGTHVLRRSATELQVGLDPRHAVVLPDEPTVRSLLAGLATAAEVDQPSPTLDLLAAHDLVLDSGSLLPLIPSGTTDSRPVARHDVAALARAAGDDAPVLLQARTSARVTVATFGQHGSRLAADLRTLLAGAGIGLTAAEGDRGRTDQPIVLAGAGEPHRELLDPAMRDSTPYLLVRIVEGSATVGPFVVPGRTACLRCLDAHQSAADPAWPLLVEQYASTEGRDRPDGSPEPVDSLVTALALAWAARDLVSFTEGRRPSSWSTTIRFDPHLVSLEHQTWLRHPACGCAWG